MKPLKELHDYRSESERTLAQLFSAAEPYRANPFRKRRINVQLGARVQARRRTWQPAALAVLLVAGTSAAAALGHRWVVSDEPEAAPMVVTAQPLTKAKTTQPSSVAPSSAKAESPPVAALPQSEPAVEPRRPQPKAAVAPPSHRARQRVNADGEDPTRVAEALRALRKEGDAKRAQVLVTEYMRKNPSGALSEEALALAIEAAHMRGDPKARQFARRYLARYPSGRHAALARRAFTD